VPLGPVPRRVSGPARSKPARGDAGRAPRARSSSAPGIFPALTGASATRLLDRLIAGKAWIVIVAFALIGIVTLQLALLELNAGIGRAIVRAGSLQRENASLSIEDAELTAGERIETQASKLGIQIIPAGEERFLSAGNRSAIARAARVLSQPAQPAPAASPGSTESRSSSSQAESVSSSGSAVGETQSSTASGAQTVGSAGSAESQAGPAAGTAPAAETPAGGSGGEAGAASAAAPSGAAAATTAGESTAAGGTQPAAAG